MTTAGDAPALRHQRVVVEVDLPQRRLAGYCELSFDASQPAPTLGLHCRLAHLSSITVNGTPCSFSYHRPEAPPEPDFAALAASLQQDTLEPEVLVALPPQVPCRRPDGGNGYFVVVKFEVADSVGGLVFHKDDECSYLYPNAVAGAPRLWLPCIDRPTQCCTWRFEVTTALDVVVLTSADTIREVMEGNRKVTVSERTVPVPAAAVGLVVGALEQVELPFPPPAASDGPSAPDPPDPPAPPLGTGASAALPLGAPDTSKACFLYGPPALLPQMEYTAKFLPQLLLHWARYTGVHITRLFGNLHFIFLDQSGLEPRIFAGLIILSTEHLLHERDADHHPQLLWRLAYTLSCQYFGAYLLPRRIDDVWIIAGLAGYVVMTFQRSTAGTNAFRMWLHREGSEVYAECETVRPVLAPPAVLHRALLGTALFRRKAALVTHMLACKVDDRRDDLPTSRFRAGVAKLFAPGPGAEAEGRLLDWARLQEEVLGAGGSPEMDEFLAYWVRGSALPCLRVGYQYVPPEGSGADKKVQVGLQQLRWAGAEVAWWRDVLWIRIVEEGGEDTYDAPVTGELEVQDYSIVTKFKRRSRRRASESYEEFQRKRHEEAADRLRCPVEFVHVDHGQRWPLCRFEVRQREGMWLAQLQKDYDVVGQYRAVQGLAQHHGSPDAFLALESAMKSGDYFYEIRVASARALAGFHRDPGAGVGDLLPFDALREYFRALAFNTRPAPFGDYLFANDFANLPLYHLRKGLIAAIGEVGHVTGGQDVAKTDAVDWLLQLLRDNNNEGNPYADTVYLCVIVDALAAALSNIAAKLSPEQLTAVQGSAQGSEGDASPAVRRSVQAAVAALHRLLATDQLAHWPPLDLFTHQITAHCILAMGAMQRSRLTPLSPQWLWSYFAGEPTCPAAVARLAAWDALLALYTGLTPEEMEAAVTEGGGGTTTVPTDGPTPVDFRHVAAFLPAVLHLLPGLAVPDLRNAVLTRLLYGLRRAVRPEVTRTADLVTVERSAPHAPDRSCLAEWYRRMRQSPGSAKAEWWQFLTHPELQADPASQAVALTIYEFVFGVPTPPPRPEAPEKSHPRRLDNPAPQSAAKRPRLPPASPPAPSPTVAPAPSLARARPTAQPLAVASPRPVAAAASPRGGTATAASPPPPPSPPPTACSQQPITLFLEPEALRASPPLVPLMQLVHIQLKARDAVAAAHSHLVAKLNPQSETAALIFRQLPLDNGTEPASVHVYEGIATWQVDKRKVKRPVEEALARPWLAFTELAWWAEHSVVIAGFGPSGFNPPHVRDRCFLEKPCTVFGEVVVGDPRKMFEPHRRPSLEVPNARVEMSRCRRLVLRIGQQELPVDLYPSPAEVVDWLFRRLPIEGNSAVYGQLVTASFSQDEPPRPRAAVPTKSISPGEIALWRQTAPMAIDHLVVGSGPLQSAAQAGDAIHLEYPVIPLGRVLIDGMTPRDWTLTPGAPVVLQRRQMVLHFHTPSDVRGIHGSLLLTLDNTPTADEVYACPHLPLYCPFTLLGGLLMFDTPLAVKKEKWRETQALQVGQVAFRANCIIVGYEGDGLGSCQLGTSPAWPWAHVTGLQLGGPSQPFTPLRADDLPQLVAALRQLPAIAVPGAMDLCLDKFLHPHRFGEGTA